MRQVRATLKVWGILTLASLGAACGGGGSGTVVQSPPVTPPPPPPPPIITACGGADTFPGFLYEVEATPTEPAELHLSSTDGCRTELVATIPDSSRTSFHMAADGSEGVILWTDTVSDRAFIRRLDFTVDIAGVLALGTPVTILPLTGEEPVPGDGLNFFSIDAWGNQDHSALYITLLRSEEFNSGPNSGQTNWQVLLYDLIDLTSVNASPDVRVLYDNDTGGWQDVIGPDCAAVQFPHMVPACYGVQELRFNPSGTRIYIGDNVDDPFGNRWNTVLRISFDRMPGESLSQWDVSGPELVFTGSTDVPNPYGVSLRPGTEAMQLPAPEFIATNYNQTPGGISTATGRILDADSCVVEFMPYTDGLSEAQTDLWQTCVESNIFTPDWGHSWQTPEAVLKDVYRDPHFDLYRSYVSGAMAGSSALVIETARGGDSGH